MRQVRVKSFSEIYNIFCANCYWDRFETIDLYKTIDLRDEVRWLKDELQRAGDGWLLKEAVRSILPQPIWEEMEPHLISGEPPNT
jgi:hypothetical protein